MKYTNVIVVISLLFLCVNSMSSESLSEKKSESKIESARLLISPSPIIENKLNTELINVENKNSLMKNLREEKSQSQETSVLL